MRENYQRYCEHRYRDISAKRPDLLSHGTELVTKLIVAEWEKLTREQKLALDVSSLQVTPAEQLPPEAELAA